MGVTVYNEPERWHTLIRRKRKVSRGVFEMKLNKNTIGTFTAGVVLPSLMLVIAPDDLRAQQAPGRGGQPDPAPTGPMANEKYKNIQALTNVQADQLDV